VAIVSLAKNSESTMLVHIYALVVNSEQPSSVILASGQLKNETAREIFEAS
jgi:hypothetical protein